MNKSGIGKKRALAAGKSGEGWYRNEKLTKWASGKMSTYYAQGYFKWGNGQVKVSQISGDVLNIPKGGSITDRNLTSGTGKYGAVFNKYAYVKFKCKKVSCLNDKQTLSVEIRVSENGNTF